jgi:hypothetical protein
MISLGNEALLMGAMVQGFLGFPVGGIARVDRSWSQDHLTHHETALFVLLHESDCFITIFIDDEALSRNKGQEEQIQEKPGLKSARADDQLFGFVI